MSVQTRESRPVGSEAASQNNQAGQAPLSVAAATDAHTADTLPTMTPEDAAAHARGAFVVVVHLYGDKHRRRVFLTLAAAQAAAERARERGHAAHVLLAQLVPLAHVAGTPIAGEVAS